MTEPCPIDGCMTDHHAKDRSLVFWLSGRLWKRSNGRTVPLAHQTKLHYELFSDAYSASCTCGWRVSLCTDRERIVRFKRDHEKEHVDV